MRPPGWNPGGLFHGLLSQLTQSNRGFPRACLRPMRSRWLALVNVPRPPLYRWDPRSATGAPSESGVEGFVGAVATGAVGMRKLGSATTLVRLAVAVGNGLAPFAGAGAAEPAAVDQ